MNGDLRGNRHDTYCFNCFNCMVHVEQPNHFYCVHGNHSEVLGRSITKDKPITIWDLLENDGVLHAWCFEYDSMGKPPRKLTTELRNNFNGGHHVEIGSHRR